MKKVLSILLSFILLASQVYLTTGTHFCDGEAVETKIILGETHLGCGMEDMEVPCDKSDKTNKNGAGYDKTPCCENKYQTVQKTDDFVKDAVQVDLNVDFAVAFIYSGLNLDLFRKSSQQFNTEYISPPLEKDIPVLFQTFLI